MDRRAFMLAGSGVAAAAATAPAGAQAAETHVVPRPVASPTRRGVTLSGWLIRPNPDHPHLLALVKHPLHARRLGSASADVERLSVWVLPKDIDALAVGGWVRLRGDVQFGGFKDAVSGYRARAVLLNAEPV